MAAIPIKCKSLISCIFLVFLKKLSNILTLLKNVSYVILYDDNTSIIQSTIFERKVAVIE
jgi:hypothetical protein